MTTKPTLWVMLCVVALAGLFSGCQSSKIAFGNSYYFKQTPKATNQMPSSVDKLDPRGADLYASVEREVLAERDAGALIEQAQQQLLVAMEKSDNVQLKERASRMNQLAGEMNGKELTKKETRAKRKELRKELRSLAKEYRSMAPDQTNDMDQKLKISLILLVAGLVFLLIPTVITVVIGSLAFAAGLVFLIIWLATEA